MLTNAAMRPDRFLRWHRARRRLAGFGAVWAAGGSVILYTATKAWRYRAKHATMFKATKSGLWVQRGKAWDNVDYCRLVASF